jgi:hypothetical protein
MKILIISPPRCGSTSLLNSICSVGNVDRISEPYSHNRQKHIYPLSITDNSVTKYITRQTPNQYGNPSDFINFIKDDVVNYNKVILLSRRNKTEHMESWINLLHRFESGTPPHGKWNGDDVKTLTHTINYKEEVYEHVDMINKISSNLNIPLTYYEDLYGEDRTKSLNIIKNWNLDIDVESLNEKLNPRFRYRQFTKKPLL